jgi:hypothetical protein
MRLPLSIAFRPATAGVSQALGVAHKNAPLSAMFRREFGASFRTVVPLDELHFLKALGR